MKSKMFQLFKYAIKNNANNDIIDINDAELEKIYILSKQHDLAHLIGYFYRGINNNISSNIKKELDKQVNKATARYLAINYELESMCSLFESAKIPFIPLKGAIIRKYYKEPWLRTSSDIDILISDKDVKKVKEVLVNQLHYRYDSAWNYEVSFYSPTNIHIEIHHTLSDDNKAINKILKGVWDLSHTIENKEYQNEMSDEMYYFYHLAHMSRHVYNGGCGIRPFIDVWVLNNNVVFDREKRYALLEKAGLLKFAKAVEMLSKVWFDDYEHTNLTLELENFILYGGSFGTVKNRVTVQQAVKGGKFRYILSRIFLPYHELVVVYPSLKKHKWLFPFYQIKRWFRFIFIRKKNRALVEIKENNNVTKNKKDRMKNLLDELGL